MAESLIALCGLALIAAAWSAQLLPLAGGNKQLNKGFVIVYALGTGALALDGIITTGMFGMAALNIACVGLAVGALYFLFKKK